jgi:FkbM family methyltransferase
LLKRSLKEFVKHSLGRFGWQLRSLGPDSMRGALKVLADAGVNPKVVFDIGVHAVGTPELYAAFPDAKFILVEPAAEFTQDIKKIISGLKDAELIVAAASDRVQTGTLKITRNSYVHTHLVDQADEEYKKSSLVDYVEVPIVTVDSLSNDRQLTGPFVLKIDVDGVDLEVLKGSVGILPKTDVVIIEAPLHSVTERANFLESYGFVLWGIVDPVYFGSKLWQVDLIFIGARLADKAEIRPWTAPGFKFA